MIKRKIKIFLISTGLIALSATRILAASDMGYIGPGMPSADTGSSLAQTTSNLPLKSGNFERGKDFDATKNNQIIKGQSTKTDILGIYGQPQDKGIYQGVDETWTYIYTQGQIDVDASAKTVTGAQRIKKLIILFDQNNVVTNFVYSDVNNPISIKFT